MKIWRQFKWEIGLLVLLGALLMAGRDVSAGAFNFSDESTDCDTTNGWCIVSN